MQWLITLEINHDPIVACRLMNVFRRKGFRIITLVMTTRPNSYSMVAVMEHPEADIDHVFNFLRRIEGVKNVACYRHETSEDNVLGKT